MDLRRVSKNCANGTNHLIIVIHTLFVLVCPLHSVYMYMTDQSLALHPSIKDRYCKEKWDAESYKRGYASLLKVVCPSITNNFVLINHIVSLTPITNIQRIQHCPLLQGLPKKVKYLISLLNQLIQFIQNPKANSKAMALIGFCHLRRKPQTSQTLPLIIHERNSSIT